jgi:hypothetical protein
LIAKKEERFLEESVLEVKGASAFYFLYWYNFESTPEEYQGVGELGRIGKMS